MVIELHVEPRKVYGWSEFKRLKPSYSIALDGLVKSRTKYDPKGPYANFDHHSLKDGISIRSTCDQVHIEIKSGLFDVFKKDEEPHANVYVNDCDEDTSLAWWLLKNHEFVKKYNNHKVNKLVFYEDRLDCTTGAYPFGDSDMRRRMAWIFEPYNNARFKGLLSKMNSDKMKEIMLSVESRIDDYVKTGGQKLILRGNYKKIGGGQIWVMTKEKGPAARMEMFRDGINAFVTLIGQNSDDSYVYAMGRRSIWVPFDLNKLYKRLNFEDSQVVHNGNHWGGSDNRGGSPRDTGSRIAPKRLNQIINDELSKK